jgi:hypothetical protein
MSPSGVSYATLTPIVDCFTLIMVKDVTQVLGFF